MRRETKYTLTGFVCFLYSLGLMTLLMISFMSEAGPEGKVSAAAMAFSSGAIGAFLLQTHPRKVHFRTRAFLLLAAITLIDLLFWLILCEGTFVPRM